MTSRESPLGMIGLNHVKPKLTPLNTVPGRRTAAAVHPGEGVKETINMFTINL